MGRVSYKQKYETLLDRFYQVFKFGRERELELEELIRHCRTTAHGAKMTQFIIVDTSLPTHLYLKEYLLQSMSEINYCVFTDNLENAHVFNEVGAHFFIDLIKDYHTRAGFTSELQVKQIQTKRVII